MYMHLRKKKSLLPFFLIFLEVAIFLSNDMYLPSMPAIAHDLSLTQAQIQYTLTLWFLGSGTFQLILGPVSDRYGRRGMVIFGGFIYALATAVCAIATTLPVFLMARFVQGSTVCAVLVAGSATIHELFDTKRAIKIFALINAVTIIAPAFGPLIGALIVQYVDWRYIFWLLFIMGTISTVLLYFYMPESLEKPHKLHLRKLWRGYLEIMLTPGYMFPSISYCLLLSIFFLWMFVAPFLMIEHYGFSNLYYGISQALIFGCFAIGAKFTSWMLNVHDLKKLIGVALIILLIGTVSLGLISKFFDSMHMFIVCMMIISVAASMLFAPLNRVAIEASAHPMGRRIAIFSTLISLFGVICGWLITVIHVQTLAEVAALITIFVTVATVIMLFTKIPDLKK